MLELFYIDEVVWWLIKIHMGTQGYRYEIDSFFAASTVFEGRIK